ncbi:MAG TPA: tRNA (adenosine(37)-N6)-dimethylallyltransferase MiaA [Candidatus Saccharimonadales bacterium]|nr:tRNA (adenosine(37)-N6)-dimethylallyltransferase MiaA [Candidatus Saccharimonadales bacterium]
MAPRPDQTPVIAIVGETASGKTALALHLAREFPGEIIAADSRTVYKDMNIGTAKPSPAEQAAIPHYGLDVVSPNEQFSAADFKRLATDAINQIGERHKIAYIVGGTGLYIDSLLYNFQFRKKGAPALRAYLESLDVWQLQQLLHKDNIPLPQNALNPRHLIRAIETKGEPATRSALRPNTLIIGVNIERDVLRKKLVARVEQMVKQGFIDEVKALAQQYGWEAPALQAPGYRAFKNYIEGGGTLEDAMAQFVQNDSNLAKRQRTWFKRNKDINWISNTEEAVDLVTTFLNK